MSSTFMTAKEWKKFINDWSLNIANRSLDGSAEFHRDCDPVHGFGSVGASEEKIKASEARLDCVLPPSYKEFLRATNGLKQPFEQMAGTGGDFSPVDKIDWFRVEHSEWIEIWCEHSNYEVPDEEYFDYSHAQGTLRAEYLKTALAISHDGDAGFYLLIPEVRDNTGEWEAWHFATWIPGANRYRSFEEMLKESYKRFEKNSRSGVNLGF